MLDKKRFLAIKNLAKDIRNENKKVFKSFTNESLEDAIRDKEEFIESVFDSVDNLFSEGEQGKEEKQIFRANVLIPDDDDFYEVYSEDKNIRSLMNRYAVGIEDIMSKITELNIYGKYLEEDEEEEDEIDDFVDEMVNLSFQDAESLLDEIEDLSNAIEEFTDSLEDDDLEVEEVSDDIIEDTSLEESDDLVSDDDDDFEGMSLAVDDFVNDYGRISEDLIRAKEELDKALINSEELKKQITSLQAENKELKQNNLESVKALQEAKETRHLLQNENVSLKERNKLLEKKIKQSSELLKKIYNSIPRK